ncbi:MAG: hypothetical protein ACRCV9_16555 [Burkholderiaceae bacterium]
MNRSKVNVIWMLGVIGLLSACGGDASDTVSPSSPVSGATSVPAPTSAPTSSPNPTASPTPTTSPTGSPTPTPIPTASSTPAPTPTAMPPVGTAPPPGTALPPAGARLSRAYKEVMDRHYATNPLQAGECAREVHDRYWTYGPDGKVYPTWHPPVDPFTGCAFGHEHGDDPGTSRLTNAPMAFGYVNEKLFELDMVNFRDEDHVGHKVLVANNAEFGASGQPNGVRCDVLLKVHQGTHSRDAFTNNLHEGFYYASCSHGINMRIQALMKFGAPGNTDLFCAGTNVATGTATPPTSPTGRGQRVVPDSSCLSAVGINMNETWQIEYMQELPSTSGGIVGGIDFGIYFRVGNASRFVDTSSSAYNMVRTADACYQQAGTAYSSPECVALRSRGQIAWNDPRSPWKGNSRDTQLNQLVAANSSRTTVWYTDVYGQQYSPTRDPSRGLVVEQFVGTNIDERQNDGPNLKRYYGEPTLRAPN